MSQLEYSSMTDRRLSKLALAAFILAMFSPLASLAAAISAKSMELSLRSSVLATCYLAAIGLGVPVAAAVMGGVALGRIAAARGYLLGRWMAVAAVVLPVMAMVAYLLLWMKLRRMP